MVRFLAIAFVVSLAVLAILSLLSRWSEARLRAAKRKKDAVLAEVTRRGGSVEIAGLRRSLEQSMAEYTGPDREQQIRAFDQVISDLETKYGTHIPFDESVKIWEDLENFLREEK